MSLLHQAMEICVFLTKTASIPDGEGGYTQGWKRGDEFEAAFDYQTSIVAKSAEVQGVTGLWNVLVPRSVTMEFHNVFERVSDGQVFRVTSKDDKKTPSGAGLDLRMVSAEEWTLT